MANNKPVSADIKFINHYKFVLRPNEAVQTPHDFILTGISKAPASEVVAMQTLPGPVNVPLNLNNTNLQFNVVINDTHNLFMNDMPYLGIPNTPQFYPMPTFWYLPRSSRIHFKADNLQVATTTVGDSEHPATLIFHGYFIETPTADVVDRLYRPLILVFFHKPAVVDPAVNPSGTVGADAITKQQSIGVPSHQTFLMKQLSYCAIRDISLGVPGPGVLGQYAAQMYCDWTGRLAHSSSYYFQDKQERIDATTPNHNWPFIMKKFVPVTGGNAVVMETTYTTGAPGSLIGSLYNIVGGILVPEK